MKTRRLSQCEVIDAFIDHLDTIAALRLWARAAMTDQRLITELVLILNGIDTSPFEIEEEGLDGKKGA